MKNEYNVKLKNASKIIKKLSTGKYYIERLNKHKGFNGTGDYEAWEKELVFNVDQYVQNPDRWRIVKKGEECKESNVDLVKTILTYIIYVVLVIGSFQEYRFCVTAIFEKMPFAAALALFCGSLLMAWLVIEIYKNGLYVKKKKR